LRDYDADANAATGDLGKAGSGLEQRVYYLTDGNFNVTALAGTDGAILERYAYDAYGRPRVYDPDWSPRIYGSSYANAILFCGYFRDAETGMYHVRNRYYHPGLGRWLSRDPLGYVDGMGLYEYVRGRVETFVDPPGLEAYSTDQAVVDDVLGREIGAYKALIENAMHKVKIASLKAVALAVRVESKLDEYRASLCEFVAEGIAPGWSKETDMISGLAAIAGAVVEKKSECERELADALDEAIKDMEDPSRKKPEPELTTPKKPELKPTTTKPKPEQHWYGTGGELLK
jgi:RHS repeat-associated protein